MGFDVRLIDHVQAVAVAQLIPACGVGIVRTAHGVKVILLHQQNVLQHILFGHHLAALVVVLMAVHPADQQRFAVEQQQAVADLYPAKADVPCFSFNQLFAVPQGNHGTIAVGRFRAPLPRFSTARTSVARSA